MRSDQSTINQLLMCMSKPQTGDHPDPFLMMKVEPAVTTIPDNGQRSYEENDTIAFGPIKVKPRKRPAPTLATGRRSKYETLSPEEEAKRDVRRRRNREAAERVRLNRLAVEQQLQEQIDILQRNNDMLETHVQNLENSKLQLQTRLETHRQYCPTMNCSEQAQPMMINTNFFESNQQIPFEEIISLDKELDFDFDAVLNSAMQTEVTDELFDELFSMS